MIQVLYFVKYRIIGQKEEKQIQGLAPSNDTFSDLIIELASGRPSENNFFIFIEIYPHFPK